MSRKLFAAVVLTGLVVVASGTLAFGQPAGAKFGPAPEPDLLNPQASIWGNIGLWKVISAETPPAHAFGTSGWMDRINRNPGQMTITGTGTSVYYSPSDRLDLGLRLNVDEKIQSRRTDPLGLGSATVYIVGL